MPKDTATSTTADAEPSKGPLKRGDACLYCRQRRRKCSATKPACDYCVKLNRECVYDSGKPVSRVKQLEERLAELEGMLKSNGGESSHPPLEHRSSSGLTSASGDGTLPTFDVSSSTAYSFTEGNMVDINMDRMPTPDLAPGWGLQGFFPNFGGSLLSNDKGTGLPNDLNTAQQDLSSMFDFSTLDPTLMNLVASFQTTSTTVPPPPPPPVAPSVPIATFNNGLQQFSGNLPDPVYVSGKPAVNFSFPSLLQPAPTATFQTEAAASTSVSPTPKHNVSYQAYVSDIFDTTPESSGSTELTPLSTGSNPPIEGNPQAQAVGIKAGDHISPSHVPPTSYNSVNNAGYPSSGEKGWRPDPELEGVEKGLVGGWFDAADLPKVARDHLLDLFFSGMRMFGQEFHVPRFYASLTLPVAKRPHPCLMYSMYLMAARVSPSPPIRSLEPHFYTIASRQLEEAVANGDRYLDATRAATILAVYKYSLARYHEGFMLTGMAARLAISCGLHQISTSVYKPSPLPTDRRSDLVGIMRQRAFIIPPPQDPIELGERIWAFWSIFIVDRCGSISAQWPPAIPDDIVATPYPKPLHEYELGLVSDADNYSISTLYDPRPGPILPLYSESSFNILRLRGISILERASKLMYLKPEPGVEEVLRAAASEPSFSPSGQIDEYLSFQNYAAFVGNGMAEWKVRKDREEAASRRGSAEEEPKKGKGWTRTARVRNPKAFEEVKDALLRIENDLPVERRTNWTVWDGKVQDWHFSGTKKDIVTLHFILGCAWMFLYDVYSYNAENVEAVAVARRLVFTIRAVMGHPMNTDLDVFIAMTWSFIVKILIREVKRLQSIGDNASAGPIEAEVETIVQALRVFGQRYNIAGVQALRAERYRKSTLDDLAFMEGDNFDDEHVKVDGLIGKGELGTR